jgi:hypothetical protein
VITYSLVSIEGPFQSNFLEISNLLDSMQGSLVITIPGTYFSSDQLYNFQVYVENFCGGVVTASFSVYRYAGDLPEIILAPLTVTTRNSPLYISASIQNTCIYSATIASMSWTSGDPVFDASLPPLDGHSSSLFIPPFALSLSAQYNFTLSLRFTDSFFANTVVSQHTSVQLVIQTPTVGLVGGYTMSVQRGQPVNITATLSDPDFPVGFLTESNVFSYYNISWSCVDRDSNFYYSHHLFIYTINLSCCCLLIAGLACQLQQGDSLPTTFSTSLSTTLISSSRLAITVQMTKLSSGSVTIAFQQILIVSEPVPPVACTVTDPNPAANSLHFAIICTMTGFAFSSLPFSLMSG